MKKINFPSTQENDEDQQAHQRALADSVHIVIKKEAGQENFYSEIDASSASAALNGIAIVIAKFSSASQMPISKVLGVLASVMIAPALGDPAVLKREGVAQ